MSDTGSVSRRALLGRVGLAAAAALIPARRAPAQQQQQGLEDGGKVPRSAKGTATLRDLRQFSAPRSVPICRGDHQQARLVPIFRRAGGSPMTGGSVTGGSVTRGLHAA